MIIWIIVTVHENKEDDWISSGLFKAECDGEFTY